MKCEAPISPHWSHPPGGRGCSFEATHLVYGVPMCGVHGRGRANAVAIDPAQLIQALREIAHGSSGDGAATDAAVMQTIARRALGELGQQ